MKLSFIPLILIACCISIQKLQAQETSPPSSLTLIASSDANEALRRKFVVAIVEPDKSMLKHLKGAQYRTYVNGIAACNNNLKELLLKKWPGAGIEFKTIEEIQQIPNKSDYIVGFYFFSGAWRSGMPNYQIPLEYTKKMLKKDTVLDYEGWKYALQFGMAFLNDNHLFFSKAFPDIFPTKTDLFIALCAAVSECKEDHMDSIVTKSWYDGIKNKTLLIRKEWVDSRFIAEDDIKKNWPTPYKLVSKNELDTYVMSADTNYLFIYFDVDFTIGNQTTESAAAPLRDWSAGPGGTTGRTLQGGYRNTISNTHRVFYYNPCKKIFGMGAVPYLVADCRSIFSYGQNPHKKLVLLPEDFQAWMRRIIK